jgi:flavin-binding protein dodecin
MAVLKVIEILSDSPKSWEDAAKTGIARASKTIKHIRSAWVQDQSIAVKGGKAANFRVTLKITFEVE